MVNQADVKKLHHQATHLIDQSSTSYKLPAHHKGQSQASTQACNSTIQICTVKNQSSSTKGNENMEPGKVDKFNKYTCTSANPAYTTLPMKGLRCHTVKQRHTVLQYNCLSAPQNNRYDS